MSTEIIKLGDYYQHNFKSPKLGDCATFIWNCDVVRQDDTQENLYFTITPLGEAHIRKMLVVKSDGRVINSKWRAYADKSVLLAADFTGLDPTGAVVKYWMPLDKSNLDDRHQCTEEWDHRRIINKY